MVQFFLQFGLPVAQLLEIGIRFGKLVGYAVELGQQVERKMTVLFADIRNFTALSETMSPQENFNFLNSYLVQMAGFYTDMCFPRLDWSNEIQAVKNTRAAIVSGLGIFVYAGLLTAFGFMVRWLSGQGSTATALSLFLFSLLWSLLASRLVIRRAGKLFRLLEL